MQFTLLSLEKFPHHVPPTQNETCTAALPASTQNLLGGSWVVISRVISRVTIRVTHIRGLITPLIATPEPPSMSLAA